MKLLHYFCEREHTSWISRDRTCYETVHQLSPRHVTLLLTAVLVVLKISYPSMALFVCLFVYHDRCYNPLWMTSSRR